MHCRRVFSSSSHHFTMNCSTFLWPKTVASNTQTRIFCLWYELLWLYHSPLLPYVENWLLLCCTQNTANRALLYGCSERAQLTVVDVRLTEPSVYFAWKRFRRRFNFVLISFGRQGQVGKKTHVRNLHFSLFIILNDNNNNNNRVFFIRFVDNGTELNTYKS